jgi:hypothetical protein
MTRKSPFAIALLVAAVLQLSGVALAANVAVANVNALDLARGLVNVTNLQLITTGSLAPKFTGHSRSAGIATWTPLLPSVVRHEWCMKVLNPVWPGADHRKECGRGSEPRV